MKDVPEMTYMDWLIIDDNLDSSVRKWYMSEFPTDDLGAEIPETVTFRGIFNAILNKQDVYDYIGVGDSIIRERCFSKLSEIANLDYDYIYYLWLSRARA